MGATYRFDCPNCGYTAGVAGERTGGFVALLTTMTCEECQELHDADLGERDKPPRKLRCPENRKHKVAEWTHPGPCPVCTTMLDRREGPELLWD